MRFLARSSPQCSLSAWRFAGRQFLPSTAPQPNQQNDNEDCDKLQAHAPAHQPLAAVGIPAAHHVEQAQKQNDVAIAELTGSLRELDTMAEIASLKQEIAGEQLKTGLAQLQLGNGTGNGPGSTPQLSPKAEKLARIDEGQKLTESLDAGFELAKARLSLLRALGHMEDWLHELHP